MKFLRLVLALFLLLGLSRANPLDESRNVLKQVPPVPKPIGILLWKNDPKDLATVTKQLQAISDLAKSPEKGDVLLIIPFLNYPSSGMDAIIVGPPTTTEDTEATMRIWPGFAAIVKNPYAKDELKGYIENKANPLNLRMAAWITLRYVDKATFQEVTNLVTMEIPSFSPAVQNLAKAIETGNVRFHGVPRFDQ